MTFKNEKGEILELADDLTLLELTEMGIDISLVEHGFKKKNEHWLHAVGH